MSTTLIITLSAIYGIGVFTAMALCIDGESLAAEEARIDVPEEYASWRRMYYVTSTFMSILWPLVILIGLPMAVLQALIDYFAGISGIIKMVKYVVLSPFYVFKSLFKGKDKKDGPVQRLNS